MKIKILGAHNLESENTRLCTLLIDGVLAVEAGALTSNLSLDDQQKLKAVLLTHQHYDHIRDIPALAINFSEYDNTIDIYSTRPVHDALTNHFLNNIIYPNFMERPPDKPTVQFNIMEPGIAKTVAGYVVLPVKVTHAAPTVGFQITSAEGKKVFYTSDTGPGLTECWEQVAPDLLITETTIPNSYEKFALNTGHLTANLLQKELEDFHRLKGYLPKTVVVHMSPIYKETIEAEIAEAARNLNTEIQPGFEGMLIDL
jgi:ribonuclease BN (tRNA processing enzyme)